MKRGLGITRGVLIVAVWASAPGLALAYIDPGNGAYMVQALFTLVGAALFYLRHPIRTLRSLKARLTDRWDQLRGQPVSDRVASEKLILDLPKTGSSEQGESR